MSSAIDWKKFLDPLNSTECYSIDVRVGRLSDVNEGRATQSSIAASQITSYLT
jgi:hypothetical protein